jgi:hypothetical protein
MRDGEGKILTANNMFYSTPNTREQVNMIFLLVRTPVGLPDPVPTHRLYIYANLALGIPQTTVIRLAGEAKQNIKYVCDPPKQDPFLLPACTIDFLA